MGHEGLFVGALAVAVAVLLGRTLANRIRVPEAILYVLLGVAVSFVPGMSRIHVTPELVLLLFLPPLVYHAAFFTAPRETRADVVPITALACGLTVVTTAAAATALRQLFPGIGWPAAVALGAAIAPTDPVAATAVLQRLGAPLRITTILEGESLINDGVALTVFSLAVESLATRFTLTHGLVRLIEVVAGGVAYGLAVGWVVGRLRRGVRDPALQIVVSLITPYLAYLPADRLGVSGVLATVVTGLYLGTRTEGLIQPASRLAGHIFWRVLAFLLESALFVLLGLEFRRIAVTGAGQHPWPMLAAAAGAVIAVVVGVRLAWELLVSPVLRFLPVSDPDFRYLPWRHRLIVGWGGMRGAISLAIALSIPVTVAGRPFPERPTLIFVAGAVVIVTLFGQATTLPLLLRACGLAESDRRRIEEARARAATTEAALRRLEEMAAAGEIDQPTADAYRQLMELRLDRVRALLGEEEAEGTDPHAVRRLRTEMVRAQREQLYALYYQGEIGADTLRDLDRELDMEDPSAHRRLT